MRYYDGYGGFSSSYYLNKFYEYFYLDAGQYRRDIMYCKGTDMIADAVSRGNQVKQELRVKKVNIAFPNLKGFDNPYMQLPERKPYCV